MQRLSEVIKKQGSKPAPIPSGSVNQSSNEYNCPLCHDAGVVYPVIDGKTDYTRSVNCPCTATIKAEKRKKVMMAFCALPAGTEKRTFENFNPGKNSSLKTSFDLVKRLADGDDTVRWVTLLGNVDRGKTHLAVAACRRYLERGIPAKFYDVSLMLQELKDCFDPTSEDMTFRVKSEMLRTVPLLVLDDLGAEKHTPWSREQLEMIINARANAGLPLIVTSNLNINELGGKENESERYASKRIASRLQRESWCHVVGIDAPEHRIASK